MPLHDAYRRWLATALLAFAAPAGALEYYEGVAVARNGGQLLYRESHWIDAHGGRLVLYRCPGGAAFARKRVATPGPAPDFELFDARHGYREGVRTDGGAREVFRQQGADAREHRQPLPSGAGIIDAGFDAYIREHWDELAQPRRVGVLLPSRLRTMDVRLGALASPHADTRRYQLSLDAWYGAALPTLVATYSVADRRLLRFEGIGNIRDAEGRYPAVRIDFPARTRRVAAPAEWKAADAMALVARCD